MSTILIDAVVKSFANAGKTYGKTQTILVNAFKLAQENEVNEHTIDAYQHTFYLNAVISALGADTKRALLVVSGSKAGGLSPFNFKEPEKMDDTNRSHDEQRVFDALKSAWSTARKAAGFPMKPVKPRASRTPQDVGAKTLAELEAAKASETRIIGCTADAIALAAELSTELATLNKTGKLLGDAGSILRDAIVAFAKAVKAAKKADLEKDAPKVVSVGQAILDAAAKKLAAV